MSGNKLGGKNQIGLPARRIALKCLKKILREKKSLDEIFPNAGRNAAFEALSTRDQALVRNICTTTLRRLGELEAHLKNQLEKPLPRKSGDAKEILLIGLAQILYMDVPTHAAIDLSVRLASYDRNAKHFKGLINAVLRRLAESHKDIKEEYIKNIPDWLMAGWQQHLSDEEISRIAKQHAHIPPLDLTCAKDPEKWAEKLGGTLLLNETIRLDRTHKKIGRVDQLEGFDEGAWWVQDIAASLPVHFMGDVRGRSVLDLCAAPGGKTLQLAARGANVTAIDQAPERLKLLEGNLRRTGFSASVVCQDATQYNPVEPADMILLDAPCSATGTLRRHPDLPYIKNEDSVKSLTGLQARLLEHAGQILKPGGTLIYCTCSLERSEGEAQIETFMAKNKCFAIKPVLKSEVFDLACSITKQGFVRTLPFYYGDSGGMDGFFIARLQKSTPHTSHP